MQCDINQLIDLVASNGFEIKFSSSSGITVISVFHLETNRESVFGFDALTERDVLQDMIKLYCTEKQALLIAKSCRATLSSVDAIGGE